VTGVHIALPLLTALIGHGPAPAALDVLHVSEGGPAWVYTNRGLARALDAGDFAYVGASSWGGAPTPLAAAFDGHHVLVCADGAGYATTDAGCEFHRIVDLEAVAVAAAGDGVWVLEGDARLHHWDGVDLGLRVRVADTRVDSLVVDGDVVWVAGARPRPVLVRWDGSLSERPLRLPSAEEVQRASLRKAVGPTLYLAGPTVEGMSLWRSGDAGDSWELVLQAQTSIHGPAPLCGGWAAVVDGRLTGVPGALPSCELDAWADRRLTCLGENDGLVHACHLRRLIRLPGGEELFQFSDMRGLVDGCPGDPDARVMAELDWLDASVDAGLAVEAGGPVPPQDEDLAVAGGAPPGNAGFSEDGGGCACGTLKWGIPWSARR